MKILILLSIHSLIINVNLINGRDFSDGQLACAFQKSRLKKSKPPGLADWIADSSVKAEDVKFLLYNKDINDKKLNPMEIFPDNINDSLQNALRYGVFDIRKLTKIIIHGYKSNKDKGSVKLVREGFFKNGDYNIIVVDWSAAQHKFGILWPYDAVVKKLDAVAEHVSRMLFSLENKEKMDYLNCTTVVGHSLGAHVAGMASSKVGSKIGRLVALDPAGPLIRHQEHRLSKDDAIVVEVIHTEIENCGLEDQMGHYDFYINGGRNQPGCETYQCSHKRSYEYFAESLDPNTKGFYARHCDDFSAMENGNCTGKWVRMGGLKTTPAEHGIYYVKTNNQSLFALGPQ